MSVFIKIDIIVLRLGETTCFNTKLLTKNPKIITVTKNPKIITVTKKPD